MEVGYPTAHMEMGETEMEAGMEELLEGQMGVQAMDLPMTLFAVSMEMETAGILRPLLSSCWYGLPCGLPRGLPGPDYHSGEQQHDILLMTRLQALESQISNSAA